MSAALTRTAARCALSASRRGPMQQSRRSAGNQGVKTNIRIEEWDGLRSEPYKAFRFNGKTLLKLGVFAVGFPTFLYFGAREQQLVNDKANQLLKNEYL